jgi:archaellum component FlaC
VRKQARDIENQIKEQIAKVGSIGDDFNDKIEKSSRRRNKALKTIRETVQEVEKMIKEVKTDVIESKRQ